MAEQGVDEEQRKCAHEKCRCPVPENQKYCSDYCASPDDAEVTALRGEAGCKCGHAACEHQAEKGA